MMTDWILFYSDPVIIPSPILMTKPFFISDDNSFLIQLNFNNQQRRRLLALLVGSSITYHYNNTT